MGVTTWSTTDLTSMTLSGGNLVATSSGSGAVRSKDQSPAAPFYFELTANTASFPFDAIGIALASLSLSGILSVSSTVYVQYVNGAIFMGSTNSGYVLGAIAPGSLLCCALDPANRRVWFRQGATGPWNGSLAGDPAAGTGSLTLSQPTGWCALFSTQVSGEQCTANFGLTGFVGAVPSGFLPGFPDATGFGATQTALIMA